MNFDKFVDWFAPVAALLLAREHLPRLATAWARAKDRAQNARMKLESFFARDVLLRLRSARQVQMVLEGIVLLIAFCVWKVGLPGYCGHVILPDWYGLALIPPVLALVWTMIQLVRDRGVRPVPFRLLDGEVYEEDLPEGLNFQVEVPGLNPGDPPRSEGIHTFLAREGVLLLDLSNPDEQDLLDEIVESVGGPGDRSPKIYAYGLVFGSMVTCGSLLLFSVFIGWHGLFSMSGVMHAALAGIGLLPIFAAILVGAGYKLVVGVGRAIGLELVNGSADALTAMVRLLATALPGITAEDAEKKVPPITGATVKALANLTEGAENKPIAALFLLVVIGALLPHPLVLIAMLAAGAITLARFGNLEANEDPDVKKKRLAEVNSLDGRLKLATTLVIVLVIGLALFRQMIPVVVAPIVEVINFILHVGLPREMNPDGWDWAKAIGLGILLILFLLIVASSLGSSKTVGSRTKAATWIIFMLTTFLFVKNVGTGGAWFIPVPTATAWLSCPVPQGTLVAVNTHVDPATVAPAPHQATPFVPYAAPSSSAPFARRARRSRSTQSRPNQGISGWTPEQRAALAGYELEAP